MKTLIVGASAHKERYAYKALTMLIFYGHEVVAFSQKKEQVCDVMFMQDFSTFDEIHTITIYLNPIAQMAYYEDIIKLQPVRVIFNPGTENPDFYQKLNENNIYYEEACTMVLLRTGQY